jgi:hypothetical protein
MRYVFIICIIAATFTASAQDQGVFSVEVMAPATSAPVGVTLPVTIAVTNITDYPVMTVVNKFTISLQAFDAGGTRVIPCSDAEDQVNWTARRVEGSSGMMPGWTLETNH